VLRKKRDERLRERGETLIELIVSTALLGILGVGMITALTSTIIVSNADRGFAGTETVLRSYATALESRTYLPCTTPGSSANPYSTPLAFTNPAGYTTSITGPTFLADKNSTNATAANAFIATCPNTPPNNVGDQGVQRFVVRAVRSDGTAGQTLNVLVRRGDPPS
jgi:Tfp pilus assembly protein PilE